MPRTKRPARVSKKVDENVPTEKVDAKYIRDFDSKCKSLHNKFKLDCDRLKSELAMIFQRYRLSISDNIAHRTISDIRNGLTDSTHFVTLSGTASTNSILELAKSVQGKSKKNLKRSLSLVDDEAEGETNLAGGRKSRAKKKLVKSERSSRSLSRSKMQNTTKILSGYKTPILKSISRNEFGTVTPKVKPNTPSIVLRRPKDGEMAISMQGSPLLVNHIVNKEANVNIPLSDGCTISIQPQRGLRFSQLPPLDPVMRRQIEALRDNLITVCKFRK